MSGWPGACDLWWIEDPLPTPYSVKRTPMKSMWSADSDRDYRDDLDRYNEPSQWTREQETCGWPGCSDPVSGSIAGVGGSGTFCLTHLREKSRQVQQQIALMAAKQRGEVA